MSHPIEAPKPKKRPWGLLLDTATDLALDGDRWRAGIKFASYGCAGLRRSTPEFCIGETPEDIDDDLTEGGLVEFGSFSILATESCTTLDVDLAWLQGRLDARFAVMASEQVAAELMAGSNATIQAPEEEATTSPNFAEVATVVTTGPLETDVVIAKIEEDLAERLHGGEGMIHMSPAVFSMVAADRAIFVNGQYRTRSGHLIVTDAGYVGQEPDGESPATNVEWVYGSGPVYYQLGPPRLRGPMETAFDRTRNTIRARTVAEAVVAFDPCTVVAAEYGYPDFLAGSGS